ncbi:hypothetical protein JRO89_XS15G0102700 [Xanthoceras sorbifolium]|uniref:Expansin-like EG45 domain-containing protein n=1 Tax=Xanthoceras sorbifolium TaxID=99658 RepID=A0ABQ8H1K3_9ROSI|nr:hypothetical protein JRO89_XS15G0102700 [Xanthoceras sorbifolium]
MVGEYMIAWSGDDIDFMSSLVLFSSLKTESCGWNVELIRAHFKTEEAKAISAPKLGWFKLNTDAALANDGSTVGLGLVIRDSEGCVLAAGAVRVGAKLSVLEVEALVVLRGVEMALEFDITPFLLIHFEDIIFKFDNVSFVDINFIPRTANSAVYGLTIFALQASGNLVWIEDVPSGIAPLISEDAHFRAMNSFEIVLHFGLNVIELGECVDHISIIHLLHVIEIHNSNSNPPKDDYIVYVASSSQTSTKLINGISIEQLFHTPICAVHSELILLGIGSSACYEHQDKGVMIAAASGGLYNSGAACGQYYLVTSVSGTNAGDPPCRDGGMAIVMITDFCPSASCETLRLSKEAFAAIADLDAGVINIAFQLI